jgi:NAD(P)-dependent dehydrogenase (short-subunit alcohol dehydrogenase family)
MRIDGKRIVITGASSGIGRSLALALGRRGADLVLGARHRDRLEIVAAQIAAENPDRHRPVVVPCDVTQREDVHRLLLAATAFLGGVDVLVNNAGASIYGDARLAAPQDYRAQFEVNFFGPLYGILEALPYLAPGSAIVNVGSAAGLHGVPYLAAYSASKAALAALGQSLRAEFAPRGIRVVNIYPGYTRTALFVREKRLGGARRPTLGFISPDTVARAVLRALEQGRDEVPVAPPAKGLALLWERLPAAMDWITARMASRVVVRAEQAHAV